MADEIERKFLVKNDDWRKAADDGIRYKQGYLVASGQASVRIRIEGDKANINLKSATLGISRMEFQYPIPLTEAKEMLTSLCQKPLIEKRRYHLMHEDHQWEIDVFTGDNEGLIVAEIELQHVDETFSRPSWLGAEVSYDKRYYNVSLVDYPYKDWQ